MAHGANFSLQKGTQALDRVEGHSPRELFIIGTISNSAGDTRDAPII